MAVGWWGSCMSNILRYRWYWMAIRWWSSWMGWMTDCVSHRRIITSGTRYWRGCRWLYLDILCFLLLLPKSTYHISTEMIWAWATSYIWTTAIAVKGKKIWLILYVWYLKTYQKHEFSLICSLPFYSIRVCPSFPTVSYTAYCTSSIAMRSRLLRRWRVSRCMVSRHQWSRWCALRWGTTFNRGSKPSRRWMGHIDSHCHGHGLLHGTHSLVQLMTK